MNLYSVLEDNYQAENQSFLYYLHEESTFHIQSFQEYYDCLFYLAEEAKRKGAHIETMKKIHFNYCRILERFLYHFDPKDLYFIKNCPSDYSEYLDRLRSVTEAYYTDCLSE